MSAVVAKGLASVNPQLNPLSGGANWNSYRDAAYQRLLTLGLPTPRDDGYKYPNLRVLERRDLRKSSQEHDTQHEAWIKDTQAQGVLKLDSALCIYVVNGQIQAHDSQALAAQGLSLQSLKATLPEVLPSTADWAAPTDKPDDRLRLMADCLVEDGLVLRVQAHRALDRPLHVIYLASAGGHYPRLRVHLETHAQLTLVEEYRSAPKSETFTLAVTDIAVDHAAQLTHIRLQDLDASSTLLEEVRVNVAERGVYQHHAHSFGAGLHRLDLGVRLGGAHAQTQLYGLFMADNNRGLHLRTQVTHAAVDTQSEQTYRGVASHRGRGSYDGKVIVEHGALRSSSKQSSRNLLLTKDAEIDTRPQLEIYTDDVQCSHGATTGTLDENMLFYLLSRGLDQATARGLLTYAFAADVVRKVPLSAIQSRLGQRVVGLLPDAALLREFLG